MIRFAHYQDTPFPVEKMGNLYRLLIKGAKDCENISIKADSVKMREVLGRLALTNRQFAKDLDQTWSTVAKFSTKEVKISGPNTLQKISTEEDAGFYFFASAENVIVAAYREILQEPFNNTDLRRMIHFQLSETLCLFMHLKLINSAKVKQY